MEEDYEHIFPEAIFSQINEHSGGGFLLFWVDENGEIQTRLQGDQPIHRRALIDFAHETTSSAKDVNKQDGLINVYSNCSLYDLEWNDDWEEEEDDSEEEDDDIY